MIKGQRIWDFLTDAYPFLASLEHEPNPSTVVGIGSELIVAAWNDEAVQAIRDICPGFLDSEIVELIGAHDEGIAEMCARDDIDEIDEGEIEDVIAHLREREDNLERLLWVTNG